MDMGHGDMGNGDMGNGHMHNGLDMDMNNTDSDRTCAGHMLVCIEK